MQKITIEVPEVTMARLEVMAAENDSTVEIQAGVAVDDTAEKYFEDKGIEAAT